MSNPWAQSFEELRSPYLQEKMAKKDYDGDGKIETGTQEYMGSRDKAIKKAMGKKVEDKKKVAEHHQKDKDGNTIPHEDGTPSSVDEMAKKFGPSGDPTKKKDFIDKTLDKLKNNTPVKKVDKAHYEPEGEVIEAKIDTVDPKNKRKRRNERAFGKQTKPYDPDTKEMKTQMGKFMNSMRHKQHQSKRGRKTTGPDAGMKKEEIVLEADKKGKGSGTKDACYHKVKSRYSVWPSAYASGALVKCRKVGAKNWGNSSKKEEFDYYQMPMKSFDDLVGECWKTHKQVGTKMKGGKVVPNCVPKNEEVAVEDHVKLSGSAQKEYDNLVKMAGDKNLDMKKRQGADAALTQGGHSSVLQNMMKDKKIKESIKITPHDISGGTKAGKDFMGGRTNPKTGKPVYKLSNPGGMRVTLAHKEFDWEGKMLEAVKSPKLDVKETGVKNKIEINPEIKTEAAKAPVKK